MTLFGVRKPPERASANQKKDSKNAAARRVAAEKAEKQQQENALCGWNLPPIPDDLDVVVWMKREKNGDNKRKKINEVYEEEQFRHVTEHCTAINNKLLFDRQSLSDRHLKHCQFGVRDARAKVTPVAPLPASRAATTTRPPSQQDAERNCFSANALNGEVDEDEEDEEEEKQEMGHRVGEMRGISRGRSHSAVCRSASMRAAGMTLPAGPGQGQAFNAAGEAEDEAEDAAWDEGYGSKVSSNDQDGGEEADSTKTVDSGIGGRGDGVHGGISGVGGGMVLNKAGPVVGQVQGQPLCAQDAMARLMYSRRERTVYERLPSRRMRGNSFRYAGREQSRLMEASLSHINPAYLARYHHLADLATQARQTNAQSEQGPPPPPPPPQVALDSGVGEKGGEGGVKGLQPRTMVLRKITIQDSGKELFSQNVTSNNTSSAGSGSTSTGGGGGGGSNVGERVYHRQGLLSPPAQARTSCEVVPGGSEAPTPQLLLPRSGLPPSTEQVSVRVQDLTPDLAPASTPSARHSPTTTVTTLSLPGSSHAAAKSVMSTLSMGTGSSPMSPASRNSTGSGRLSAMSSFAVTDLLPAVERNLRHQRISERGMNKSKTAVGISAPFAAHQHQQHQQHQQQKTRGRHPPRNQQVLVTKNGGADFANGGRGSLGGRSCGGGGVSGGVVGGGSGGGVDGSKDGERQRGGHVMSNGVSAASSRPPASSNDVRSFPGFRPHHQATPLQRAKEIANRRMHGHVTHMPDGSETVRVPSPRYASLTDQQTSHRRAKSASRLLGQVMTRYAIGQRNSAV